MPAIALQIRPLLMLVDESGRLRAPAPGAPNEVGVLGALIVPAYPHDLGELRDMVRRLKKGVLGNPDSPEVVKAGMCGEGDLRVLAASIKHQYDWLLAFTSTTYSAADAEKFRDTIRDLGKGLSNAQEAKPNAAGHPGGLNHELVATALRRVEAAYERLAERDPVYAVLLFRLLVDATERLRADGILPLFEAHLDERPRAEGEAVNILARFAVYTQYPEVYSKRIGELVGLEPTRGFTGHFTSDDVQAGLIVADILAGAKSRVLRGDDPDGRWGRFMGAVQLKPGERSLLPPVFRLPGRILHDVPRLG